MEARAPEARRRDGPGDRRLPLAARDQQWNKIEHRLFSAISQNWRAKPLVSHEVIVKLIAATTTRTGLRVRSGLDTNAYPAGRTVSDAAMATLHLRPDTFHGEWDYSLTPRLMLPQE